MIGSFLYWSDRAIQRLAEDNGVELTGRARWTVGIGAGGFQAGLAGRERLTRNRLEEARRVRRALGRAVVEDFAMPPPAAFIQATGRVSFAQFEGIYAKNPGALLHLRAHSPAGQRIDVCLFGSQDNVSGFGPWDDFEGGWISSEAPAIDKLLRAGDGDGPPTEDDTEALAVEALKIALHQGMTGTDEEHAGRRPAATPSATMAIAPCSRRSTPTSSWRPVGGASTKGTRLPVLNGSSWAGRCGFEPCTPRRRSATRASGAGHDGAGCGGCTCCRDASPSPERHRNELGWTGRT